jgi:predicted molibdopterin-dependent oxidoreductase YjgC
MRTAEGQFAERLTAPLVRRNGALRPASWDEALELVATRIAAIKAEHGADAFGCFSCSKSTNELNYVAQKFMRAVIGTSNIDSCNRT